MCWPRLCVYIGRPHSLPSVQKILIGYDSLPASGACSQCPGHTCCRHSIVTLQSWRGDLATPFIKSAQTKVISSSQRWLEQFYIPRHFSLMAFSPLSRWLISVRTSVPFTSVPKSSAVVGGNRASCRSSFCFLINSTLSSFPSQAAASTVPAPVSATDGYLTSGFPLWDL